jgi:hypothetical protein
MLAFVLLGSVLCAASVPPVDDPDTAIDESEFQVVFLVASQPSVKLVSPLANSLDVPNPVLFTEDLTSKTPSHESMLVPKQTASHSHSLHQLLCTFLI